MNIPAFLSLIEKLSSTQRVIIQAHDFPDHDAVSAAFGLGYLLQQKGLNPVLTYNGFIDRISLQNMIEKLEIPLLHSSKVRLNPMDKIITVDGCIGEKNVTDMPGHEVAVIDHHQVKAPSHVWYSDVRPSYGATASMIVEYYNALDIEIPEKIASALMIGLSVDTANLTRGFCQADVMAFAQLQELADTLTVNRICRNQLVLEELDFFSELLHQLKVEGKVAYAMLPKGCPKNMLGVLGDFVLSVHEVDVSILAAEQETSIQVSLRSECEHTNAGHLARTVLNGGEIGFGGGHKHMAGGIISHQHLPVYSNDPERFMDLFRPHL